MKGRRWTAHVARIGITEMNTRFWWGKIDAIGKPRLGRKIILKCI